MQKNKGDCVGLPQERWKKIIPSLLRREGMTIPSVLRREGMTITSLLKREGMNIPSLLRREGMNYTIIIYKIDYIKCFI